jgi:vancomycin aglycone glucosyltransferase
MRVLLSTIGSRGDVQPLVALATELRALEQDVRLCVPPDFTDWIGGLGFSVTPIGPELRTLTAASPPATPAPLSPERRRELAEASVSTQFEIVATAAQGCDVIVAATALQIAARSVAEKMRIPYVFVAYCPNVLPSAHHAPPVLPALPGLASVPAGADNHELWARDAERFNGLFGAALNAHRASIGLAAVDDARGHVFTSHPWLAADATLAPWPDPADEAVFQPGAWILLDRRPLSVELRRFLDAGEPPIYFGFGSIRAPHDLSRVMIETARALGRRAIVSRGWANLALVDEAPDCLAISEVNQQALFTHVAAVVHHGGAGTTTAAAQAGAPQVVIPQMYDQHYWARRIQILGIGTAHAPGAPTADSLTGALAHALQPDVSGRAQSIGGRMRRDGASAAAQRLIAAYEAASEAGV